MPKQSKLPKPARFGIQGFAELLSARPAILGEVAGSFDTFREGLIASLIPVTPYECVVAESLIAIEWELFQRRRMHNAEMREDLRFRIKRAVEARYKVIHDAALDANWRAFIDAGGYKNDEPPWVYRRVKHSKDEPYDKESTYPRLYGRTA